MVSASTLSKASVISASVLALCGWAISLGAVANAVHMCDESEVNYAQCSEYYHFEWWGTWFTFGTGLTVLLLSCFNLLDGWVSAMQSVASANTAVAMVLTREAVNYRHTIYNQGLMTVEGPMDAPLEVKRTADTGVAGFVVCAVGTFMLILMLATHRPQAACSPPSGDSSPSVSVTTARAANTKSVDNV